MLEFGSVTVVKSQLPSGVTHVKPADKRYGRNLHLFFPLDGGVIIRSEPGTQDMVGRSDMAWLNTWAPYSMFLAHSTSAVSVFVPSRILDESADSSYSLPVVASSNLSLRTPVREFVRCLTSKSLPPDRLPNYLVEKLLLEMTLSLLLESQGMQRVTASVEQSMHARAMAYISAYKSDVALTPAKVAGVMNISLRQLQRSFAAEGSSITEEIRRQRVETAARLLTDQTFRHLDLTQVAVYAGFGGPAELRRAISAVHGCTPTQLRISA